VGRLVKVTTGTGDSVTGRVVAQDDEHATLDVDGSRRQVALADVAKAFVQIEFNRPGGTDREED
jgi:ribosome maturation factor RimP